MAVMVVVLGWPVMPRQVRVMDVVVVAMVAVLVDVDLVLVAAVLVAVAVLSQMAV